MLNSPGKWLLYLAVLILIVMAGWRQPLRYWFMSESELAKVRAAAQGIPAPAAVATPVPGAWMHDPARKSVLDRDPTKQQPGRSVRQR